MSLMLVMSLVLVACHLGKASVLRHSPEEPADAQSSAIIRTNRCLGDPLQSVRKAMLDSLNLQTEPHVSVPGMAQIREQWINVFKGTTNSESTELDTADNTTSSSLVNSTRLQCCKLASEIFIKDLGWDKWIIYPESFTYVQCSVCNPQEDQHKFYCSNDDPSALDPTSQKPCCKANSRDLVPFLYLDETSTLIINSVPLTRECGCSHGDDAQALQP